MLEGLGYRAEAVAGGEEAFAYLKDKKAGLIIPDMIMYPEWTGWRPAEELSKYIRSKRRSFSAAFL